MGTEFCEDLSGLRMPRTLFFSTLFFSTYLLAVFQDLERLVRIEEDLARVEWARAPVTGPRAIFLSRTVGKDKARILKQKNILMSELV